MCVSMSLVATVKQLVSAFIPLEVGLKARVSRVISVISSRLVEASTRIGVSADRPLASHPFRVRGHQRLRARIEQAELDRLSMGGSDLREVLEMLLDLMTVEIMDELDRLDDS